MALTSEGPEWGKRGVQTCDRGLAQQSPETGGWKGLSTTPGVQNWETGHGPGAWPRVWGGRRGRDYAHGVQGPSWNRLNTRWGECGHFYGSEVRPWPVIQGS